MTDTLVTARRRAQERCHPPSEMSRCEAFAAMP
jgi:hypothetical protein